MLKLHKQNRTEQNSSREKKTYNPMLICYAILKMNEKRLLFRMEYLYISSDYIYLQMTFKC